MSNVTAKLVKGVPGVHDVPELQEHVGRYLVRYEPSQCLQNEQWLWTTKKKNEALVLPFEKMMDLLKTPIGVRQDGKLDRPITVFTIEISKVGSRSVFEA